MAVVQNFNQDNQQDNNQQQGGSAPNANQPVSLSGGGPAGSASYGSSAAPTVTNKPTSSGRYTNLKSYLDANKNYNSQGGGFGGQIYSNLDDKQQGIQTGFQGAQKQFQDQANQGRVQYDNNVVTGALANPTQYAQNQDQLNAFARLRDATYGGPTELAQAQDFKNQTSNFQGLTQQTQSEQGRYGLLNNLYGTPKYNQGQQQLDNLFLQADPQQLAKLQTATQLGATLGKTIDTGLDQDKQLAQSYQNEANATKNATQNALSNTVLGFNQQAINQANAYNDQATRQYNDLRDQLSHGQIPANLMKALGLSDGMQLYGIDPTAYLAKNNFTASAVNAINSDQAAQIQALHKLAGGAIGGQANDVLNQFINNASQANQAAGQQAFNLNANALLSAVNKNKADYDSQVAALANAGALNADDQKWLNEYNSGQHRDYWNFEHGNTDNYNRIMNSVNAQPSARSAALANLNQQYGIGGYLRGI